MFEESKKGYMYMLYAICYMLYVYNITLVISKEIQDKYYCIKYFFLKYNLPDE